MRAIPALQAFIESKVGGGFNVVTTQIVLGAAATQVLAPNFERMGALIVNTSAINISALPNKNVTAALGIQLAANGGSLSLIAEQDLAFVGWDWWAVPASGTPTVTTLEIIRINLGQARAEGN